MQYTLIVNNRVPLEINEDLYIGVICMKRGAINLDSFNYTIYLSSSNLKWSTSEN